MKKWWAYVVGFFGLLAGWLFIERGKRKTAEALNENVEVKEEVQKIQGEILKNDVVIASEEAKRTEISEKADDEKNKPVTPDELLDFFKQLK